MDRAGGGGGGGGDGELSNTVDQIPSGNHMFSIGKTCLELIGLKE